MNDFNVRYQPRNNNRAGQTDHTQACRRRHINRSLLSLRYLVEGCSALILWETERLNAVNDIWEILQ